MTTEEFESNEALVKNWHSHSQSEIYKLVREAMDQSSPVYQDIPEISKESAEAKYWFVRGYTFYHKKLQELATLPPVKQTIKANYGVKENANRNS